MNAESSAQMEASTSLQVWVFENLLRAFANGGATQADVLARLRRLLATGTSPTELLKAVRRSQLTELLQESAQGVLDLLNDAIRREAGEVVESAEVKDEVKDAEPQAVPTHEAATNKAAAREVATREVAKHGVTSQQAARHEVPPREAVVQKSVARQPAAREPQIRTNERTPESGLAAAPKVAVPAADLAAAQAAAVAEQRRSRDLSLALAEKEAVAEASRAHLAEILRDYERQKGEMRTLRDALAARDATLFQMQHSLDERDTQLAALQKEHATAASTVEAHADAGARLETDLQAALARADAVSSQSKAAQEAAAVLNAQLKRGESRLAAALTELSAVKTQSTSYLELIRSREWRRGFDHNMIRELDAQIGAANAGLHALESERDRLQSQLAAADSERSRLTAELAARDRALQQAEERASSDTQRVAVSKETAHRRQAEHAAQIAQLRAEQAAHIEHLHAEQATQIAQLRTEQAEHIERLQAETDRREERIGAMTAHLEKAHHPAQALESERDRLQSQLAAADSERVRLTAEFAARDRALQQAEESASSDASERARLIAELATRDRALLEAQERASCDASERAELAAELAVRDQALLRAQERASSDTQRVAVSGETADSRQAEQAEQAAQIAQLRTEQAVHIERLQAAQAAQIERLRAEGEERAASAAQSVAEAKEAAELWQAELATQAAQLRADHVAQIERLRAKQAAQIEKLRGEAVQREEELDELMTLLQGARRPAQAFEADLKRLTEELAAKDGIAAVLDEQNRKLAAILEWTCAAVEECKFIMRRLDPSESGSADILGRIQASVIERLKSVSRGPVAAGIDPGAAASGAAERLVELVRIDGEQATTYLLAKRTRIGRAAACELKIDSGSVSRHHALVIVGPHDTIIEDLNSTNGVLVNGRKVTRRALIDGDALTIGDTRFRYFVRSHDRLSGANSADGVAPRPVIQ